MKLHWVTGLVLISAAMAVLLLIEGAVGEALSDTSPQTSSKRDSVPTVPARMLKKRTIIKPIVCITNVEGNPRTASLFEKGSLNNPRSRYYYMMTSHAKKQGRSCKHEVQLVEYNINNYHRLRETRRQMDLCTAETPCIITGDEMCSYPPHSNPYVIGRFYYSSDYKDMPVFGLGSIIGFNVTEKDWPPHTVRRPYLFNFIGSRGANALKKDRSMLIEELENTRYHVPSYIQITDRFKVETVNNAEVQSKVDNYREVLLNSDFTLDPVGDHDECFRFWEAIQAGSIPVFVPRVWGMRKKQLDVGDPANQNNMQSHNLSSMQPLFGHRARANDSEVERDSRYPFICPDGFGNVLETNPPIVLLNSWAELASYMSSITPGQVVKMRHKLKAWSRIWWKNQSNLADDMIQNYFDDPTQTTI